MEKEAKLRAEAAAAARKRAEEEAEKRAEAAAAAKKAHEEAVAKAKAAKAAAEKKREEEIAEAEKKREEAEEAARKREEALVKKHEEEEAEMHKREEAQAAARKRAEEAAKRKVCIPIRESDEIFHRIDTNHNHELGPPELYGAIRNWANATHRQLTEANVHWIEYHAAHDAATNGQDATMDHQEFWMFINQFVHYFKIKNVCQH